MRDFCAWMLLAPTQEEGVPAGEIAQEQDRILASEIGRESIPRSGQQEKASRLRLADPGRNRDETRANPTSFDVLFPIDLDQEIELDVVGEMTAASALQALRRKLPYTVRPQSATGNARVPHADLESARLVVPMQPVTARQMMALIVASLPKGWQATALAGRIILYMERKDYASGLVIARS